MKKKPAQSKPQPAAQQRAKGRRRPSVCSRFKVVGNYLYAPIESSRTFETKTEAQACNRRWTKDAAAQGMRWRGRAVAIENEKLRDAAT